MLPMRSLRAQGNGALARNRRAALAFHDADHGDGRSDSLAWLDELLQQHGITDAAGEVWLHTYPRVFGYSFKPVSFWYAHVADGSLRAVVGIVESERGAAVACECAIALRAQAAHRQHEEIRGVRESVVVRPVARVAHLAETDHGLFGIHAKTPGSAARRAAA
jgi:hypothetical protein